MHVQPHCSCSVRKGPAPSCKFGVLGSFSLDLISDCVCCVVGCDEWSRPVDEQRPAHTRHRDCRIECRSRVVVLLLLLILLLLLCFINRPLSPGMLRCMPCRWRWLRMQPVRH